VIRKRWVFRKENRAKEKQEARLYGEKKKEEEQKCKGRGKESRREGGPGIAVKPQKQVRPARGEGSSNGRRS